MPCPSRNLRVVKRKKCSMSRGPTKVSTSKESKRAKIHPATNQSTSSFVNQCCSAFRSLEKLPHVTCECDQLSGSRRRSASQQPVDQEGKENELIETMDSDRLQVHFVRDRQNQETEEIDYRGGDMSVFLDDDSNQILPVEQFFGNLDVVQDFPQRSSARSILEQRKNRRRHYYAREDDDGEEVSASSPRQEDD